MHIPYWVSEVDAAKAPGHARAEQRMRFAIVFAVCVKLRLPTELLGTHLLLAQQAQQRRGNPMWSGWLHT